MRHLLVKSAKDRIFGKSTFTLSLSQNKLFEYQVVDILIEK